MNLAWVNKQTYVRDYQRQKVYKAEMVIKEQTPHLQIESMKDVIRWVAREIMDSKWWRDHGPAGFCWVTDGRRRRRAVACNGSRTIKLPKFARHQLLILHEIAHLLSNDGHGPMFCDIYLSLVNGILGKNISEQLRLQFVRCNVDYCYWS